MTYTAQDVYNAFFSSDCRQYNASIAEDFHEVDPDEMATMFFDNIDKDSFSHSEYRQVRGLAKDFEKLVHDNFNFYTYIEDDTGFPVVRVY